MLFPLKYNKILRHDFEVIKYNTSFRNASSKFVSYISYLARKNALN